MSLFDSWLELHGNSITKALGHLNNELGTAYQHGRFNQWRKGTHIPSAEALRIIHNETLDYTLNKLEKDETVCSLIYKELELPNSKNN